MRCHCCIVFVIWKNPVTVVMRVTCSPSQQLNRLVPRCPIFFIIVHQLFSVVDRAGLQAGQFSKQTVFKPAVSIGECGLQFYCWTVQVTSDVPPNNHKGFLKTLSKQSGWILSFPKIHFQPVLHRKGSHLTLVHLQRAPTLGGFWCFGILLICLCLYTVVLCHLHL